MPTIQQLPVATSFGLSDELVVAQGTLTNALPIGTLLQSFQPQITMSPGSLLGRCSAGDGPVELVVPGIGLQQGGGNLVATGTDHLSYGVLGTLAGVSEVIVNANSVPARLPVGLLRGLFTGSATVSISASGTLVATQFRLGQGAPPTSLGATGDAYLDTASGEIWNNNGGVWGDSGVNILLPEATARIQGLQPLAAFSGQSSGLVPLLLASGTSLAPVAGRSLVRLTGSVIAQDQLSGDAMIWDLAAALRIAAAGMPTTLVGAAAITVFAQDASMSGCNLSIVPQASGAELIAVGLVGRAINWSATLIKVNC